MSTIHHFMLPEDERELALSPQAVLSFTNKSHPKLLHQWTKVLRFQVGDKIALLNGEGMRAYAHIVSISNKEAMVEVTEVNQGEPLPPLHVLIPFIKPKHVETIVAMATQLGATRISFLETERTQIDSMLKQITVAKLTRLDSIVDEACEQSERLYRPEFDGSATKLTHDSNIYDITLDQVIIGIERDSDLKKATLTDLTSLHTPVIAVGPEGGWTEQELDHFKQKGALGIHLKTPVLRAETAAVALISALQAARSL